MIGSVAGLGIGYVWLMFGNFRIAFVFDRPISVGLYPSLVSLLTPRSFAAKCDEVVEDGYEFFASRQMVTSRHWLLVQIVKSLLRAGDKTYQFRPAR